MFIASLLTVVLRTFISGPLWFILRVIFGKFIAALLMLAIGSAVVYSLLHTNLLR